MKTPSEYTRTPRVCFTPIEQPSEGGYWHFRVDFRAEWRAGNTYGGEGFYSYHPERELYLRAQTDRERLLQAHPWYGGDFSANYVHGLDALRNSAKWAERLSKAAARMEKERGPCVDAPEWFGRILEAWKPDRVDVLRWKPAHWSHAGDVFQGMHTVGDAVRLMRQYTLELQRHVHPEQASA